MTLGIAELAGIATLVGVLFSVIQWIISTLIGMRARDVELYNWGSEVIDTITRLENLSEPDSFRVNDTHYKQMCDEFRARSSALVDKGRLFFPNIDTSDLGLARDRFGFRIRTKDYRSRRVKILDEVLRAYMVAKWLGERGPPSDLSVKQKLRAARRRFLSYLQQEMRSSLKRSSTAKAGSPVSEDPADWPD